MNPEEKSNFEQRLLFEVNFDVPVAVFEVLHGETISKATEVTNILQGSHNRHRLGVCSAVAQSTITSCEAYLEERYQCILYYQLKKLCCISYYNNVMLED